tara:strand:- start:23 stop:805 length:783 start_codon:yes stop_codon:yes gene_type:complete
MKKYLVIGNPIEHSLSPKLHNYWIRQNNLDAIYEKKKIEDGQIQETISSLRNKEIQGINVTVPFKQKVIPFLDELTKEAKNTKSVNTIYITKGKIFGDNTDIFGFERAFDETNYDLTNKKVFIIGAGGVVPSIIYALKRKKVSQIIISNRTKKKAERFNLEVIEWGKTPQADLIINATSLGLKKKDNIPFDFSKIGPNKFFFDVIYNPSKTNFLIKAEEYKHRIENGKMMFIYQAAAAFKIWHNVNVKIDKNIIDLLKND